MNLQLKKAIFNWMIDNSNEFQLVNETKKEFRQYIYNPNGEYCYGGEDVSNFIDSVYKIV